MNKQFIEEQKKKLKEEKKSLEKELSGFAKKDPNVKGNWETKFQDFGVKTADSEEEISQVEEYNTNLPIEHALEIKLQKVNQALDRIKKNKYGICQNCNKKINMQRLGANAEASSCLKCIP